jgi:hypothetical protein
MKALLFRFRLLPNVRVKLYLIKEERTGNNLKDVKAMKIYTPVALLKQLFPNNLFPFVRRNRPGDERIQKLSDFSLSVCKSCESPKEFDRSIFDADAYSRDIEWEKKCRAAL